jgi:adenylate kinase family enzyme
VARQTRPGSLVARFGLDSVCNGFHASDNPEKSKEEIDFFFPQISSEKLPSSMQEVSDLLNKKPAPRPHVDQSQSLNDVLVEGLTQLCRVKPTGLDAVAWLADWLARNNPNKPKVSQPVEDQASVSVLEAIAAREGQAVNVLWAVGGPGSGREEYVASIASSYGYEVLDSAALLAQSEGSGTEYGELLRECKASGKPVPTHVPVNLIKQALSNSRGSTRFIINGFPNSMDEAFHFEKVVGAASKIVYFDCSDATRLQRIGDEGVEQLKVFKASVHPVIEHYLLYSKVGKVSTDGTDAQIKSRIKKHVK